MVAGVSIRSVAVCGALLLAAQSTPAATRAGPEPALCTDAARQAAIRHGVPIEMMMAITLVETRRVVGGVAGPWPWTLNVDGQGYWHASRAEALAHAEREIARGRTSVDLGCFQLNFRWHGAHFAAPHQMLDPALGADYAARFLGVLHAETGDWMRAAGHYHSRSPIHAERYRGLVERALARMDARPGDTVAANAGGSAGRPAAAPDALRRPLAAGPLKALWSGAFGTVAAAPPLALAPRQAGAGQPAAGAVALRVFGAGAPLLALSAARP